jgi:hypothetical protein
MIANAVQRSIGKMFPGFYNVNPKRNIYADYGYPDQLTFHDLYATYRRNGIAHASVEKTKLKTWQDYPEIWESETPTESQIEKDIRQRLEDLRFWQKVSDADARSMVGGYAGIILRLADNKGWTEPVDRVPGGLDALVEVIPAWAGQLTVSEWGSDERDSETYGQPKMFQFNEAALPDGNSSNGNGNQRSFNVHPDRVIIWSKDGTVNAMSDLEPSYNSLLDMEKIAGAGGEGFWKTARAAIALEIDKDAVAADMAAFMGVTEEEIPDKLDDAISEFLQGFGSSLMTQGMKVTPINVSLPSPEHFFATPLQMHCSSWGMPIKIMVGMQTGERASQEDAAEWSQTVMSRRVNLCRPTIKEMLNRLERFGMIPDRDWVINWSDLTEASMAEKIDRAVKMANVNSSVAGPMGGEIVFTPDEIREVVGMEPLTVTFEGPDDETN